MSSGSLSQRKWLLFAALSTVIFSLILPGTEAMDYCPQFIKTSKACTCYSYIDGAMIECEGPDSTDAVEQLKLTNIKIRELTIKNADIIEIGPRAFRNLQIKNLVLDGNRIRKIHRDAFHGLERSLLGLSINQNKLTEIPTDALTNLVNLQTLSLKCNNIGNIYTTAFRNVSNLIELNLACNQICRISANAFDGVKKKLQSLILDQNCLSAVPAEAFRGFESILALHMQHNRIQSIKQLEFMNMLSLMMVRLSGNSIRAIHRQAFTNIPNLRYLYLDRNRLTSIEPNALQQFRFLEIIDLSYNNIAEIPAGAFSHMEHLMQLILDGNMIVDIQPGAFSGSPILLLMLSGNCLGSITQQTFQGLPFLRQLSLAKNNLKQIQQFAFAHMANLQMLDLSGNMIDTVPLAAFGFNLQITILLKENPVVCTQGYHLIQAGQGIHLLGQEDMICKDENKGKASTCPKIKEIPPPPPCCASPKAVKKPVSVAPSIDNTPKSLVKSVVSQKPFTTATTTAKPDEGDESLTTTKPRQLNLERFWRLTRPPPGEGGETTEEPEILGANSSETDTIGVRKLPTSSLTLATTTNRLQPTISSPRVTLRGGSGGSSTNKNQVVVIDGSALPPNIISAIQASGTLPPNFRRQPIQSGGRFPTNPQTRPIPGQQLPRPGTPVQVGPNGRPVFPVQGQVQQGSNQVRPQVATGPQQTINNGPDGRIVPNPTFNRQPLNLPPGFSLRGLSRGPQQGQQQPLQPQQQRPQFVRMPDGSIRAINPLLRRRPVGPGQFVPNQQRFLPQGQQNANGTRVSGGSAPNRGQPQNFNGRQPLQPGQTRPGQPNQSFGPPLPRPVQPGQLGPRPTSQGGVPPQFRPVASGQQRPTDPRSGSPQGQFLPGLQQGGPRDQFLPNLQPGPPRSGPLPQRVLNPEVRPTPQGQPQPGQSNARQPFPVAAGPRVASGPQRRLPQPQQRFPNQSQPQGQNPQPQQQPNSRQPVSKPDDRPRVDFSRDAQVQSQSQ